MTTETTTIDPSIMVDETEAHRYGAFADMHGLPPVIVERLPSGRLDMIDGYHRAASAWLAGYREIRAVVIDDMEECREIGDEDEWIELMEERARLAGITLCDGLSRACDAIARDPNA